MGWWWLELDLETHHRQKYNILFGYVCTMLCLLIKLDTCVIWGTPHVAPIVVLGWWNISYIVSVTTLMVWKFGSILVFVLQVLVFTTIRSASAWIRKMASGDSVGLFLAFLWWLWCWRNNMVLRDTSWSVTKIILNIIFMHYDIQ